MLVVRNHQALPRLRNLGEICIFLIGAFAPISVGAASIAHSGGLESHPLFVPLCMLAPMLSAAVVQKASGSRLLGREGLGLRIGVARWSLVAPTFAAIFVLAALALSIAAFPSLLASKQAIVGNLGHLNVPHNMSTGTQMSIAVGVTVLLGPIINLPIFLGEEVGWRGFLNPRLQQIFGRNGLILGGAVWALWHFPIILLGHNYPVHPWLGLLVWMPLCICMNVILATFADRSGSVLPCALAHGMMNQLTMLMLTLFIQEGSFVDVLHGPAGLAGLAILAPFAVWQFKLANTELNVAPDNTGRWRGMTP